MPFTRRCPRNRFVYPDNLGFEQRQPQRVPDAELGPLFTDDSDDSPDDHETRLSRPNRGRR